MPDPLVSLAEAGLRWVPPLVLTWLALLFGRTLRGGATPLIERIARLSRPGLPAALCRYTRQLTAFWCAYFVVAAVASAASPRIGPMVWAGTVLLFVVERWLRPRWFPGEAFPGLVQQLRDTWTIWRTNA